MRTKRLSYLIDIKSPICAFALIVICALGITLFSRVLLIDDAYISYRYALNLVRGNGFVFNPGEHVEGYTNLLWTLLMVIPLWVGIPIDHFAAVVGISFGVLAALQTWRLLVYLAFPDLVIWLSLIALSTFVHFWLAAANGLEGGLVAFLLACSLYHAIRFERPYLLGIYGGLLFMTRPDTLPIVPVFLGYFFATKAPYRKIAAALGTWLAFVLAITAWRLIYYQEILPNTVFAKSPGIALPVIKYTMKVGAIYSTDFLFAFPYFLCCLVLAVVFMFRTKYLFPLVILVACQFLVTIRNGGDWMPDYRLLSVYGPSAILIIAFVIDNLLRNTLIRRSTTSVLLIAGMILSTIVTFRTNVWENGPVFNPVTSPCYQEIATRIQPALLASDKIAPEALGHISYVLPNTYFHDIWGLTDRHIAYQGEYQSNVGKLDRVYSLYTINPTIFIVHNSPWHLAEFSRISHGEFEKQYHSYELKGLFNIPACGARIFVSIQNESVGRFMSRLQDLGPQPLTKLY